MQAACVLVTGASGFIGRSCLHALRTRGVRVHGVSRREQRGDDACWHQVDLGDPPAVRRLIADLHPTHLLHLAWDTSPRDWATATDYQDSVTAGLHLLDAFAAAGGRRAVLVGSCAEYDWTRGSCREDDVAEAPATAYGAAKRALRLQATALAATAGLSLAWARVFFVYGPHEPPTRLVPTIARALLRGEQARCTHGTQRRDFLHVHDVADALASLLAADVTGAINVGSGEAVEVARLARGVARRLGRPDLLALGALEAPLADVPLVEADVTRLRQLLHWRPRLTLDAGLDATVAWYRTEHARHVLGGSLA